MYRKSLMTISFLLVMVCMACKNKGNPDEKKGAENAVNSETPATEQLNNIAMAQPLSDILPSCSQSKNYQREVWPGENSCSWALEKQIIRSLPEYVKRDPSGLSFQTDQGAWNSLGSGEGQKNLLVNAYLPDPHLFILKHFTNPDCPEYQIYDPKTNRSQTFEGNFFLAPDQRHFAILGVEDCAKGNTVGRFSKSSGTVLKNFSTTKRVAGIKWTGQHLAFSPESEGFTNFQMVKLP